LQTLSELVGDIISLSSKLVKENFNLYVLYCPSYEFYKDNGEVNCISVHFRNTKSPEKRKIQSM